MATQAYLDNHRDALEKCVSEGFKELLQAKPTSPLQFMAAYFAKQAKPDFAWPSTGPEPDFVSRVSHNAMEASKSHKKKQERKAVNEPSWDAQAWLSAEGCSTKLATLLLEPLKKGTAVAGTTTELELVRALAAEKEVPSACLSP